MNKKLLLLIAFFFSFVLGYGQVADYSFSQFSGTYTAFSGVQNYNWDDFVTENTIPIGFSFEFNGITHTTCSINSNGYITFGSTVSSATSYLPISTNGGYAGSISALGMDLESRKYIVYGITGTAPNRVFTVQWTETRRYEGRNLRNGDFNFQIRLNESSNVVQVVYGGSATNYDTDLNAQVGLRGSSNSDFNNRSVTNNWSSSAQGTINTASCRTGSGSGELPVNGLTFTWTPKPVIASFTPNNSCGNSGVSVVLTGRNFTDATTVNFNGVAAVFVVNSSTQITAQLPNTATTGTITVITPGGTTTSTTSFTVNLPISNNNVSYSNGTSMPVNATANEGNNLVLNAPVNTYFATVNFASYGTPNGTAPNFTLGACHSITSQSVAEGYVVGNTTATIPATNTVFTDPCEGTGKRLFVTATYAQPICNGSIVSITGATPSGGTGTFTYQWQSSTTSATAGFAAAVGSNNSVNYTSGPLTQNTWFRRVVTSCTYSSTSAIVMVRVNTAVTQGTIGSDQTICSNTAPSPLTSTAVGTGSGAITYEWQTNASGSYVTIAAETTANYSPPVLIATTSYQRRTVSVSGGVTCYSPYTAPVTISVVPPQGDEVTYGAGSWIGFVYANTNGGNPPTNAFSTTYRGYVTQTESFDLNLGVGALSGPNVCGSYADNFAVRFKMNRNLPAGCYTFTVGGDDGYRLSLDGGLTYVINNWNAHSYQETTSTVYLSGTTNFVLEYFENGGQSRVRFLSTFLALGVPVVGAITQPTCVLALGSVSLSGLPATGSRTIIATPNTAGLTGLTGTGATATVGGLVAGTTYTFSVSNGTCTSPISSNVSINPLPLVATYNGTWTNGPPTIEQSIVFSGNYTSIGNLEGCDCTVNSGVQVTVQSGHTLKITNAVKVNTAAGTSLTLHNNASLVQVNDAAVNSGVISYIRSNSTTRETDYTYWSSPVAGQKLIDVSPKTPSDFFYSFNAADDNWNNAVPSTVMGVGTGYIIRGPKIVATPPPPLAFHEATFKGTPNNGKIELPGIIKDRSYLLGNPYPSALSANRFINDNSAVLDGTLYFWTHMTPIGDAVFNPGSGVYAYSSNDYATYNLTGGLATNPGSAASQSISAKPTGEIAAGQAFFTSSRLDPTNNTIVFNNRMRLDVNDAIMNNSQFFKVKNSTKKTNTIEKHRVWLNLTNTQGAFKQMLVGYITGATNDYDSSFDGPSYNGNEFIDFYSISEGEFLAIQGRTLPFDENDFVALGYSSAIEGDFSISIDEVDGLLVSQNIYLEDKLNNSIHNLTKEAYTFTTAIGTFDDRFVLRYTDKTLGVADLDQLEDQVIISKDKNELKIKSATETIKRVTIFDLLGKKVFDKEALDETEFRSSNVSLFKQMGIVKVTLANGQVISKKVAF
ncbi:PA14 domain-containing protein [Flavobacterium omnivorum]|uniref:PA14 domain-containing protein n=1 Tax=Flavobacterium omnivorum TaxID=178355 RepID=A0A1G7YTM4_9FLAO|nr:T9SS sorting signal type C domain-containing protein [Flavobacterium omnivorum]SDG99821.1 PA14 domain-containing protein [Flavobacterium omnivorum]